MVGPLIRVGLGVYVGLCILLFFRQASMVYYPTRRIMFTPADVGLVYEDVFITTSDGERIAAWHVPAEDARGTLLMCHGNGGNNGDRIHAIEFFHSLGMNVFIFDYRGYGASTGRPSEEGTYLDVAAAWEWLVQERSVAPEKIVVHGRSLGGAIATWLAERETPAGLVIEATFTSIADVGRKLYPFLPIRLLCRFDYDTLSAISGIRSPVLISHSRDDEMIPFAHARKLFEAAPEPKVLFELSGSHNDGEIYFPPEYRVKLSRFFDKVL